MTMPFSLVNCLICFKDPKIKPYQMYIGYALVYLHMNDLVNIISFYFKKYRYP